MKFVWLSTAELQMQVWKVVDNWQLTLQLASYSYKALAWGLTLLIHWVCTEHLPVRFYGIMTAITTVNTFLSIQTNDTVPSRIVSPLLCTHIASYTHTPIPTPTHMQAHPPTHPTHICCKHEGTRCQQRSSNHTSCEQRENKNVQNGGHFDRIQI